MAAPWEKYGGQEQSGPWAKYGGAPPQQEQPRSWLDSVSDFAKGFTNNLQQTGEGMVNAVKHPIQTVQNIGAAQDAVRQKAEAAFKRGDYAEGVRHVLGYLIPVAGPSIDASGDKAQQGKVAEALGEATSTGLQLAAPGALEANAAKVVPAAETAATAAKGAVKGAAKAAVEPIEYGHLRIPVPAPVAGAAAGGYAGSHVGMRTAGALVGAATPIVRGAVRGAKAALAERLSTAVQSLSETPGMALAKAQGINWGALSADDQAILENAAKAQANAAAQPTATPRPAPAAPAEAAPAAPGKTVAELLREEMEAKRSAQPQPEAAPAQPVAAAKRKPSPPVRLPQGYTRAGTITPEGGMSATPISQPLQGIPTQTITLQDILRKPAPAPEAPAAAAQAPAAEVQPPTVAQPAPAPPAANGAPKPLGTAQAEAAMARMRPVVDTGHDISPTGERYSPQYRGQQVKANNIDAKAQRFAQALHDAGITVQEAKQIPAGRLAVDQISKGGIPGWGNITDDLVSRGVLQKGELPPNESIPKIIGYLKKIESNKIAQQLADEMRASGTIQ